MALCAAAPQAPAQAAQDRDLEVFQAPSEVIVHYFYFRETARAIVPLAETEKSRPRVRETQRLRVAEILGRSGCTRRARAGLLRLRKGHYAQAAKWLRIAQNDALLHDYALYWNAETNLALNHNAEALAQLKEFRQDYPDSVITEEALQSLGVAALAMNQPAEILAALDDYPQTKEKPALLFLRAEAREQSAQPLQAAADYQTVYLRFPSNDQAREAGEKLGFLRSSLGDKLPAIPIERQIEHASTIFAAHQWGDARNEYSHLLPQLTGADRERAQLRIMECGVALGAGISQIAALKITDPDVDAERYYTIANYYRDMPAESQMVAAVESAVARAPDSRWSESALFLAGNYYWVQLDRDRAASYYQRLSDNFPAAADALPAQWRVTWAAVLKRQPKASADLAEHLRRFPVRNSRPMRCIGSADLSEEAGNAALARTYYAKLLERFPQNYFAIAAAKRLRALGPGAAADADVLAKIPAVPAALPLGDTIPAAAAKRQLRADALRSIALTLPRNWNCVRRLPRPASHGYCSKLLRKQ